MSGELKAGLRREVLPTLTLAGPIIAGNVGQVLIGLVDTLMIGKVGVDELGAAAFVNNLFFVPLVTMMGLLAATPVLVSQHKGANQPREVGRCFKHSLFLALVASLLIWLVLEVNGHFLHIYRQEPDVVAASRGYYSLIVASLLPALIFHALKGMSEGLGWSVPPMLILMAGIAVNGLLDWLLIFGIWKFPKLGLEGAGWATLIARWMIAIWMFAYLMRAKRFRPFHPRSWFRRYRAKGFAPLLKLGLPTSGQHLFEVGAFGGAGLMIGWLGKESLAAHQIALSCAATAFMVPLSVSLANGIRVGEAYGAMDWGRLRPLCLSGVAFTVLQTILVAAFFLAFGHWIAGRFTDDPAVIALASSIFLVIGLFQIVDGAQVSFIGSLRGMSDVNIPTAITFVAYWLVALPLGYLLGFSAGFGVVGVWCGLASGLGFAAICLGWRARWVVRSIERRIES